MSNVRPVALGTGIVVGPIAMFFLIAVQPFERVSWLGGGFFGILLAVAVPGLFCIALLHLRVWERVAAAAFYLLVYTPLALLASAIAGVILLGRSP